MSKMVLVTGASGFLASHIIYQLLSQQYHVRATARAAKLEGLQKLYRDHPSVEIVKLNDIAHDQLPESAFVGVEAVIHTASPLPGRVTIDIVMKSAIEGSLNILSQGERAGVKKFVVTGSSHNYIGDPAANGVSYRANHWNPITKEEASGDSTKAYAAAKKYAELAVWEWAEQHPHVEVTTINPPTMYGPFAPLTLPITPGDFASFSTNLNIYNLLTLTGKYPARPAYADVRDVARAHVGAIGTSTPSRASSRRRVIFASPYGVVFEDVLKLIKGSKPELERRLITSPAPHFSFDRYDIDFSRIEEVTSLRKEGFHTMEQSFLDTVDALLNVEEAWKKAGYIIGSVPSAHYARPQLSSAPVHGAPDDRHLTARIFASTYSKKGDVYLGGLHFQLDGSPAQFWGKKELDPNGPFAGIRRKKDWNQATFQKELKRSVILSN